MKNVILVFSIVTFLSGAAVAATAEDNEWEDAVVITVIGEPARSSEVPFGSSVVGAEALARMDALDLADGLTRVEGVYVREYGGVGSTRSLSIRGAQAKQTLVMIDGQPLNNHQGGDVDFNAVSLEDVERVEITAGSSSALYGANATSGVVNVITRGRPEERRLNVRTSYGTYDTFFGSAVAATPLGKAGLEIGGNYRSSGGFRENDDYVGKGGHLKFTRGWGRGLEASVRGYYQTGETGVPGSLTYPSPRARQTDDNWGVNAGAAGDLTEALYVDLRGYYGDRRRHYVDPGAFTPTDDTHDNNAVGARALSFWRVTDWNRLGVGGEWGQNHTDSTALGVRDGASWAAFLQEDLRFGELTTVAGCRYDSSGVYGDAVSPRAGVRYRFNDVVSARTSAGRGFRAPTFDELFWPQSQWGGGNPDLKPEYVWTYEGGPAFRFGNRVSAEATYFYAAYDDLINGWPPENVDRANVQGYELSSTVVPVGSLPTLSLTANGAYTVTRDAETGDELDYRPKYTSYAEVAYEWRRDGGLSLAPSVSGEFVGSQQYPYTDPQTFETSHRTLTAYALANARLGVGYRGVEVFAAAKNLGDRVYQTVYDYAMPGRVYSAGVTLAF